MAKLDLYEVVRKVPQEALQTIDFGRMKGKSSINPMWVIKTLTENFGMCGIGWKTVTHETNVLDCNEHTKVMQITLHLYVLVNGVWSEAIEGFGSSLLQTVDKNGISVNKEAAKMARTDALGNACKMMGFGADVYWSADQKSNVENLSGPQVQQVQKTITEKQKKLLFSLEKKANITHEFVKETMQKKWGLTSSDELDKEKFDVIIKWLQTVIEQNKELKEC